mmetsp:Transcript_78276/g.162590  ORF Transcript_78276/g.162590 Transcript_78276/m.162590 type:complete len:684 (+) Transcript_78276:175-2226(+)|eukprot:CAMPEP_0206484330 /NCGR_PEP_ID=MMETSP0324_2-20121206/39918_1 /ASSEMBLY_ACC=CAM_ASM_000836 /TAXON_ID=2866 /ORGANISM="Crypthecodinium cohnii, Strain Seligo" /LENGTH=683 /DNA_ID=CAMNT_0053962473 /DNA_START=108 /DNA_END=2159 /DNA_ORIENTATION=-
METPTQDHSFQDEVDKTILEEAGTSSWIQPRPGDFVTVECRSSSGPSVIYHWRVGCSSVTTLTIGGVDLERCVKTMRKGETATFKSKLPESNGVESTLTLEGLERRDDLLKDGRLVRTTVQQGRGYQTPRDGSELRVRYARRPAPKVSVQAATPTAAAGVISLELRASEGLREALLSEEVTLLAKALLRQYGGTIVVQAGEGEGQPVRIVRSGEELIPTPAAYTIKTAAGVLLRELDKMAGVEPFMPAIEVPMVVRESGCVCAMRDWLPGLVGLRILADMRAGQRVTVLASSALAFGEKGLPEYGIEPNTDLEYDVELTGIYKWDDVSVGGTGNVLKKTVKEGEGQGMPAEGLEVTAMVEVKDDDSGKVLLEKQELKFEAGLGKYCAALEETVLLMKKGEEVVVKCLDVASCTDPALNLVGEEKKLMNFYIELIDFDASDIYSMEEPAKLARCTKCKEAGSRFFQAGAIHRALRRYSHVAGCLSYMEDWKDAAVKEEAAALRKVCNLNAAACWLKLNSFKDAESACNLVLRDEPTNIKALFRKAKALEGCSEWRQAEQILRKVLELDKENKEAARTLLKVRQMAKQEEDEKKAIFSKMAKGIAKDAKSMVGPDAEPAAAEAKSPKKPEESHTPTTKATEAAPEHKQEPETPEVDGAAICRTLCVAASMVVGLTVVSTAVRRYR